MVSLRGEMVLFPNPGSRQGLGKHVTFWDKAEIELMENLAGRSASRTTDANRGIDTPQVNEDKLSQGGVPSASEESSRTKHRDVSDAASALATEPVKSARDGREKYNDRIKHDRKVRAAVCDGGLWNCNGISGKEGHIEDFLTSMKLGFLVLIEPKQNLLPHG